MAVHTDFKFHPQVTQVGTYWGGGGHSELYLVEGSDLALIDSGCTGDPENYIAPALAAMGRSLRDIAVIINTHGHFDHAGANAEVVMASGAQVWMPEGDAAIAEDLERQFATYFAQYDVATGRRDRIGPAFEHFKTLAKPTKIDRALKHGEILDLGRGVELEVIPTPGHSAGSVSLYWQREGLVFTGDAVPGAGGRPKGVPLIYNLDDYDQSLARLQALDIRMLCQSHHYLALSLTRESVKYGQTAKKYLAESRMIARIFGDGMRSAIAARPEAPFHESARAALAAIDKHFPLALNPETGLPLVSTTGSAHSSLLELAVATALYSSWCCYASSSCSGAEPSVA
jgi:glyoxylase-like metal-dependent hydrolase (beta-lactamase superfamily II)